MTAGLEFIPKNGGGAGIQVRERKQWDLEQSDHTTEQLKAKGYLK